MKKNLQDIDKLFKAALDDHTERPPDTVWDAIDQRLDKNKVVDINRKYVQLKRVAIGLLVLLLGFGAYTLNHWTKITNQSKTDSTSNSKVNARAGNTSVPVNQTVKTNEPTPTASTPNVVKNDSAVSLAQNASNPPNDSVLNAGNVLNAPASKAKTKSGDDSSSRKSQVVATTAALKAEGTKQPATRLKGLVGQQNNAAAASETTEQGTVKNIVINHKKQHTSITNGSFAEASTANNGEPSTEIKNKKNTILLPGKEEQIPDYTLTPLPMPVLTTKPFRDAAMYKTDRTRNTMAQSFLPAGLSLSLKPGKKLVVKDAGAFSATIFYSPNIASNLLKEEAGEHRPPPVGGPVAVDRDDKDKIRKSEYRQSSYSIGLLLDYNLSKHWSVQSGVALTTREILINPKTIYAGKDDNGEVRYRFNCSSGYTYFSSSTAANPAVGDTLQVLQASNTLKYVSVPLALKYHYYWNKMDFFVAAGTSFNMLSKGEIIAQTGTVYNKDVSTTTKISGLKPNYFSGNFGVGLSYALSRSIALSFMPSYNFAVNSSTRDATVKTYPNNFSLAAGVRFKL